MKHLILIAALILAACGFAHDAHAAPKQPHIVLYIADDHGIDFVGCYGNSVVRTPNIDGLAKQSTRYTSVFAGSPTCVPSRSILYTGLHSARNGAMGNHTTSRTDIQSLPAYLRPLGYRVVLANKVHVYPPSVYDFEYIKATLPKDPKNPRKYRQEGLDTAEVDRFLADHARQHPDQPLCLVLADNGPHVTWEKNHTYDPAALPMSPILVDTPITRRALANYYQDITSVDRRVGQVLASLTKHGYDDSTLFIYTSDQGAEWPRSKWTLYDTGLRVPFLVRSPAGWSSRKPGSTCDALLSFVDMTPTFIDIAGGKPVAGLDGRSCKTVLTGGADTFNDEVYACHTRDANMNVFPQRCVRDSRYKYILNLMPENKWGTHFTQVMDIPESHGRVYGSWLEKAKTDPATAAFIQKLEHHPAEELYDTQADRWEMNNLAGDPAHQQRLAAMRAKVLAWMARQNDPDLELARKVAPKP